ncbi:unnamed protein product [Closterium sp. Yama58-4]|nr:unnamed protein product [Closterium sp. Yama58-4]
MAACDVAAMQRSGLRLVLAAALAALMLSACAPRAAEALRLACTDRSCGANARCLKSVAGWADCVCDRGFKLLPNASCAQFCTSADCGENGYCEEEQGGLTTCRCNTGFAKTADGCVDTCVLLECGVNGQCVKDEEGAASCVCDAGFTLRDDGKSCAEKAPRAPAVVLPPAASNCRCPRGQEKDAEGNCVARSCGSCKWRFWPGRLCCRRPHVSACRPMDDTCKLQACGENGRCVKDEAGTASCVCDIGFTLQDDGRTCTDNCILKWCQKPKICRKMEDGAADCVCKPGHAPLYGTCVGPTTCGNCPALATCTLVSSTRKAPYCVCPSGFGMTDTGCVRGASPTVSSASLTFYSQPEYALTPSTFTMRVRYSGCTNLPSTIARNVRSYWRVDRAPGGAGHCRFVNVYRYANCVTLVAQLPALSLTSIDAEGVSPTSAGMLSFMCVR